MSGGGECGGREKEIEGGGGQGERLEEAKSFHVIHFHLLLRGEQAKWWSQPCLLDDTRSLRV